MVCGTSGSGEEEIESSGIAGGHAYSLLSTHVVSIPGRHCNLVRLVKLRNPWGSYEWKGAWSDSDETNWSRIDQNVRKEMG